MNLEIPIENLELSVRASHVCERLGAVTVGDLTKFNESEIRRIRGCGRKTVIEIKDILIECGLNLAPSCENASPIKKEPRPKQLFTSMTEKQAWGVFRRAVIKMRHVQNPIEKDVDPSLQILRKEGIQKLYSTAKIEKWATSAAAKNERELSGFLMKEMNNFFRGEK